MPVFEHRTHLPFPRPEVFDWFTRPGALVRLTPPFGGSVRREPSNGIRPGSTAVLGIGAPGSLGLGLGSAAGFLAGQLPFARPHWAAPELPWHARHTELVPGERFQDVMDSGPLAAWRHDHIFADAVIAAGTPGHVQPAAATMTDRVDYELPAGQRLGRLAQWPQRRVEAELERIMAYRRRQLLGDLEFHARHGRLSPPERHDRRAHLTVAVSGAHGLIGTQLCALLTGAGHTVLRLVRPGSTAAHGVGTSEHHIAWDPARGTVDRQALGRADVVVNLAGESIGGRFTERHRQAVRDSRVRGTLLLARTLAELAGDGRQRALINASAIGYYGAQASAGTRSEAAWLDESAPAGEDFLARVCRETEAATGAAEAAGVRVVRVRTGLVLSPAGGMLQQMLPLFLLGVGGPLGVQGDRDPWVSWIGVDDVAALFAHAVQSPELTGPVNAVAPQPVRAKEFAWVLGRVLRRPAVVPVPGVGPRLLLGKEGAALMVEASQRVSAEKALASGYRFRDQTLETALRHVLGC